MIGALRGKIISVGDESFVIDVQGVGYRVHSGSRYLAGIFVGQEVSCAIETIVREDMIKLIGFVDQESRAWFNLLLGIQGVGPAAALAILDVMAPSSLADAIALQDASAFMAAKGIGKKSAERIVLELKGKSIPITLTANAEVVSPNVPAFSSEAVADLPIAQDRSDEGERRQLRLDLVSALKNLGFDEVSASRAVAEVLRDHKDETQLDVLVTHSLRLLSV